MDDWVLFKFTKINKDLLKSLVNSEIYFSLPDDLNDPFDCRVDIARALENAILISLSPIRERLEKFRVMNRFFEKAQADIKEIGVCSFSLKLTEPATTLMWAHYADNHRGICLTYGFTKSFFDERADHILGVDEIEYGVNPLSDWFIEKAPDMKSFDEFGEALIKKVLTIKAKPWEYEKEVRILRRTHGTELIEKFYLKQVCFGLETSEDDIILVRELLDRCGYKVIPCKMIRNTQSDFGFEPVEI
ncbi:MAG: DUF2971 domain-containing protein [Desulfobaccales bacterium]